MATNLTLRGTKNAPLTYTEMDGNFSALGAAADVAGTAAASAQAAATAAQSAANSAQSAVSGKADAAATASALATKADGSTTAAALTAIQAAASSAVSTATAAQTAATATQTAVAALAASVITNPGSYVLGAGSTNITHALHANRYGDVNQAGPTTGVFAATATSGALQNDAFYLRNSGAGTFTASGAITAPPGYQLTAGPGVVFSADYDSVLDAWFSTTPGFAPLASPAFIGNPTVPTQASADNSTKAASTAFVQSAIGAQQPQFAAVVGTTSGNLARHRAALVANDERILIVGDSNVVGCGTATDGSLYNDTRKRSWPTVLASLLTKAGRKSDNEAFVGAQNIAINNVEYSAYDTRFAYPLGGVAQGTGSNVGWWVPGFGNLGGNSLTAPATGGTNPTTTCSISFASPFNRFRIKYLSNPPNSTSVTLNVDGGATLATLNASPALAYQDTGAIVCPLGYHTLNITANAGGFPLMLVEVWNTYAPGVRLLQAGWAGGKMGDVVSTANLWSAGNEYPQISPNLTIVAGLTINDANAGTSSSTWQTSLNTLLDQLTAANTDILMTTGLSQHLAGSMIDNASLALQAIIRSTCATRSIPYVEMHNWSRNYPSSYFYNPQHLTYQGYQDWAAQIANALLTA